MAAILKKLLIFWYEKCCMSINIAMQFVPNSKFVLNVKQDMKY